MRLHDPRTGGAGAVHTLADVPMDVACRIESIGVAVRELGYYLTSGLRTGGAARVLARYPETRPRYVEVEVGDDLLVTIPLPMAAEVVVSRPGWTG